MSLRQTEAMPVPMGLGAMLARLAASQSGGGMGPLLSPPSMQPMQPMQPSGFGGAALMDAMRSPSLPEPVPRVQSASPGAGGIGASPMSQAVPAAPKPRYSKGQIIAGIFSDALSGAMGQPGAMAEQWGRERAMDDQRSYEEARWHRDRNAKREDDMRPRVEQVGDALGTYDPAAKTFEPIYTRPQPFEAYARAQGFDPGTPEYGQAVEDYRLGGWSDPAVENRTEVEGVRSEGRSALETVRAANRLRETRERLGVTRRGQDMGSADRRYSVDRGSAERRYSTDTASGDRQRGQDIGSRDRNRAVDVGSRDRRESASFRGTGGRGRAGGGAGSAARIVDPKTGRAAVVKNGKWVDEATGKPLS